MFVEFHVSRLQHLLANHLQCLLAPHFRFQRLKHRHFCQSEIRIGQHYWRQRSGQKISGDGPLLYVAPIFIVWLVVWNMNGLWLSIQLGMKNHPN